MPIPTLSGLQTALSGILADQAALDTEGQNVANVNTPGYSQETVNLSETTPLSVSGLSQSPGDAVQIGTGVDADTITRVRDTYLDAQYRAQNANLGSANTLQTALGQVQDALQEPSANGLSAQLSSFWSSWSNLANGTSTSSAASQAVVDDGTTLAQGLNSLNSQLTSIQTQASAQLNDLTGTGGQLENDANQIASLNTQISAEQAAGQTPNTLMDQRDQALDDLSSLGNISVTNNSDGSVTVNFGDAAQPLVQGSTVNWPQTITSATGGTLGQLTNLASSTGTVGGYIAQLDTVANDLTTDVNALQPDSTPFFSGTTSSTISVVATPSTISASSTANPGSNDLADAIAGLRGGDADSDYESLVTQVGDNASAATTAQTTAQALTTDANNRRQSVSGVSIDESMEQLLQYQQAYQASARTLTTLDSTLDTLINHTGEVGL